VSKETIKQHEGSKYLKPIYSPVEKDENDRPAVIHVDVYAVLEAFDVKCPAIAHCIKKLLMPGQRGKGNIQADLKGAMAALNRAIELQDIREGSPREHKQVVKIPTTTESAMPTDPEELKARLAEVTGKTDETLEKVAESAGIDTVDDRKEYRDKSWPKGLYKRESEKGASYRYRRMVRGKRYLESWGDLDEQHAIEKATKYNDLFKKELEPIPPYDKDSKYPPVTEEGD
jgi:hypothetical protein